MTDKPRKSLPFEPADHKKPSDKPQRQPIVMNKPPRDRDPAKLADSRIPEHVSKRMIQRSLVCCGTPTVLGMLSLVGGYVLAVNDRKLPNELVLLVSLACLGLSVLGLTYGILSASWEDGPGSLLGIDEFQVNFDRMKQGYLANQELRRNADRD
jgi:Photosynthesis affected mutant 68